MRGLSPWFDLSCAPSHLVGGGQRLHLGVSSVAGMRRGLAASNATVPACPRARARRVPAPALPAMEATGTVSGATPNAAGRLRCTRGLEAAYPWWHPTVPVRPVAGPHRSGRRCAANCRPAAGHGHEWAAPPTFSFLGSGDRPPVAGAGRAPSDQQHLEVRRRMAQQIEEQLRDLIEPLAKAAG